MHTYLMAVCSGHFGMRIFINCVLKSGVKWYLLIKDTLGQLHLFFVRRLSSLGGAKCIRTTGRNYFGTSSCVLCGQVYYIVSLLGSVHYQRFHCSGFLREWR